MAIRQDIAGRVLLVPVALGLGSLPDETHGISASSGLL